MSQDDVYSLFSTIGEVENCKLVRDKATGSSAPRQFGRVVHGSILCDPIQPNPSSDWPNPTQPTASGEIWTQPDATIYN